MQRPVRHLLQTLLVTTVALLATLAMGVTAPDADSGVVPIPAIHVTSRAIWFHHKRALLIQSIIVRNIRGMHIQVSCNRCERYRTRIHERRTSSGKRFTGVNWVIVVGRNIHLHVTHAGQIGRYLLLGAGPHDTLVFKASGCLGNRPLRQVGCPQAAPAVPVATVVPGGNPLGAPTPQTPTPAVDQTPSTPPTTTITVTTVTTTPAPPAPTPSPAPTPPPPVYYETSGGIVHTWTNYTNAGGTQGPSIPSNDTVQITCRVTGFRVEDGNTWWYQIASSPWDNVYYGSADAFYNNGQTSGSLIGTPFVDPAVPIC